MTSEASPDRLRVVLTHPFFDDVVDEILRPHVEVVLEEDVGRLPRALQGAAGLVTLLSVPVNAALLDAAPDLSVVGNFAVGLDNIDIDACRARGVDVVHTPDVLNRATAELSLTLLMAAARRVSEGEALCRAGAFDGWDPKMLIGLELWGRRALIVGHGRIGVETAQLFSAIGLDVDTITRDDDDASIRRKLTSAQVVSMHVPLTDDTRGWLSKERLALLPKDAIVINTARGPVVDEEALIEALEQKRIFAAGLDVYAREPEIPERLRALKNAVLLPHLGSATERARKGMARLACQGVLDVLQGRRPPNLVT